MKRHAMALLAVLGMTVALAAPAAAADELGVSKDAVTWSSELPGSLFDNSTRWVPGDSRTATFYVRNQSADYGKLTIDILGDHVGTLLDLGVLHITASGGGFGITASDGVERRLYMVAGIPSGDVVPINITVDFDDTSTNESQLLSTDLKFRVALSDDGRVLLPTPSDPADPSDPNTGTQDDTRTGNGLYHRVTGALPNTGAPEITWITVIGSILLGIGIAVVSRRRRNPQGESHV